MNRQLAFAIGALCYAFFFVTYLYFMGFMNSLVVGRNIDNGPEASSTAVAILINVGMLVVFAVQHTIMARPGFKDWWTKFVPTPIERSVFVLIATALVALMIWQWRPLAGPPIWDIEAEWAVGLLKGISILGFGIVLYSSFLIDHFDLFGVRQVFLYATKKEYTHHPFMARSLYKLIRHPLMIGFIIAFWSTPYMTEGHLLFAAVTTGYIVFGIHVEERDLVKVLGDDYLAYRKRTPALIPFTKRRKPDAKATEPTAG